MTPFDYKTAEKMLALLSFAWSLQSQYLVSAQPARQETQGPETQGPQQHGEGNAIAQPGPHYHGRDDTVPPPRGNGNTMPAGHAPARRQVSRGAPGTEHRRPAQQRYPVPAPQQHESAPATTKPAARHSIRRCRVLSSKRPASPGWDLPTGRQPIRKAG